MQRGLWLAGLLNRALNSVPFYDAYSGDKPRIDGESAWLMLHDMPVLTREHIQQEGKRLIADHARDLIEDATGGSTGTPMRFWVDSATQIARESSLMWADGLAGWSPGMKMAMLWGSDRDVSASLRNWRLSARWWIENRRWYNAFDLSEAKMHAIHDALTKFRPYLLVAYAGTLFEYARFLRKEGMAPDYPLGAMISSAEMLTPEMRKAAEAVFHRPVFDRYGNREFGAIATECDVHGGLHVNEADCVVEIDSPTPDRLPGRILVTYLRNQAMPFIRYDTGDVGFMAASGPCACGRNTSRLAPVMGRSSDMIRTRSGRLIHGEFFTHLLYGADGVNAFQFVQESWEEYVLLVVADHDAVKRMEPQWKARIQAEVGDSALVQVKRVDAIPLLPSGKRKFTLCKLEDPEHGPSP